MSDALVGLMGARVRLRSPERGVRPGVDPVLLARFAAVRGATRFVDVGAGSGAVALCVAALGPRLRGVALEVLPALADACAGNLALNGCEGRVRAVCGDVRTAARRGQPLAAERFEVALMNPPYRALAQGSPAATVARDAARHEVHGDLGELVRGARALLEGPRRLVVVYAAERVADLLSVLRAERFAVRRLRCVHARADGPARLVLVDAAADGRPTATRVEAPLVLHAAGGAWSDEAAAWLG